jgi:hypothetical protein
MPSPGPDPKRVPCSIRLNPQLVARAKRLARDYAGKPLYLTLSLLVEQGLEKECARIERQVGADDDSAPDTHKTRVQITERPRQLNNDQRPTRRQ